MKKIVLISIVFAYSLTSYALKPKSSYITVGYIKSELNKKGESDHLKSKYGMSISAGYTKFLNREPVLGKLYFGLDWTYLYGSFRQHQIQLGNFVPVQNQNKYYYSKELSDKIEIDQTSIGMQFGPSVTAVPIKDLQVSAYFRYAPTLGFIESAIDPYNPPNSVRMEAYEEKVSYAYTGYYMVGLSVSYKVFMASIEHKWASMTHDVDTSEGVQNIKFQTRGTWFSIGVRLGKKT